MKITDSVLLSDKLTVSADGYLEAAARTARTGIQYYRGVELDRPDLDIVAVYRDESEVFAKRSLETFSKLPITLGHPAENVTAENWRDLAVGTTGDDVLRDGEYLKIGLKITDAAAVKAVQDGKRELSVGYMAEIVWEDGTADGKEYQAVQRNIVANHIAIVDSARAGSKACIGDAWGASPVGKEDHSPGVEPATTGGHMTDQLKTVVLGDAAVQVAIADVAAIEAFKASSTAALKDAQTAHADAIAAKDEEIGTLKAQLKAAQDAANVDIDSLVAARSALVTQIKALDASIDVAGKTDAEIRRAAVVAKMGDVKDASDAEIAGMFRVLAAQHHPVGDVLQDGLRSTDKQMTDAWSKSVTDLNAWRN